MSSNPPELTEEEIKTEQRRKAGVFITHLRDKLPLNIDFMHRGTPMRIRLLRARRNDGDLLLHVRVLEGGVLFRRKFNGVDLDDIDLIKVRGLKDRVASPTGEIVINTFEEDGVTPTTRRETLNPARALRNHLVDTVRAAYGKPR